MRPQNRNGKRYRNTFVVALLAAATLVACGSDDSTETSEEGGNEARSGGSLSVAVNAPLTCLDPQQSATLVTLYPARQVVDSLTEQDPNDFSIHPRLASSWEVNDDATEYTFTLRDDVTFTDGTALTAEVIKANFDSIINDLGQARGYSSFSHLGNYEETIVLDEHIVQVNFSQPNVSFLQASSTPALGIFAEATVNASLEDRCQGDIIGSGPFIVSEYDAATGTTLTRNEDYNWASPIRNHEGPAYLDEIVFRVIEEDAVRVGEQQSGNLDIDTTPLDQNIPTLEENGFEILTRVFPGQVLTIAPNLKRPLVSDPLVGQAINFAIDRDEVLQGAFTEYDKTATSLLASTTPGFEEVDSMVYDPEEAKRLLDEAGWVPGDDGIRVKDGDRLVLVQNLGTASRGKVTSLQIIQEQLAEVGIELDLSQATAAQTPVLAESGEYDLTYVPNYRADGDAIRNSFSVDSLNRAQRAERDELDDLLDLQNQTTDVQERQEKLTEAVNELIERGLAAPIVEVANVFTVSERVEDAVLDATSRLDLYDAWVTSD